MEKLKILLRHDLEREGYDLSKVTDETINTMSDEIAGVILVNYWVTFCSLAEKNNIKKTCLTTIT